ncbi:unnamed protein product [Dracunculus medinensis]|uniref:Inheritance of peroxisomes protein 1 n=1 Tax=Dracunculus medinensis TaxID=318479 RepID=A0A0N4UFV9_DRAME|nr:unnamed protein product [Dracunculus medinensis]
MMLQTEYFDDIFAEAFACFEQGLSYDEVGDKKNAEVIYDRGLKLVQEILKEKRAKKCKLYKNMMDVHKRVEERLRVLKKEYNPSVAKNEEKFTAIEKKVKAELRKELKSVNTGEAELIFFISNGVQLFMIEGDEISTPTIPAPLEIFRFFQRQEQSENIQAFIKVGPWVYPLISGKTPILKNEFGAYVVPNPTEKKPDMFVGILLPSDLDKQCEDNFMKILKTYTEFRFKEISPCLSDEEKLRTSQKIAQLLIKGNRGEKIAWGIDCATEKTTQIVSNHLTKYQSSLKSIDEPVVISPALRTSVYYVHRGSKIIAKCTRFLLDKIGDIGVAVGQQLASSAEKRFGDGKGGGIIGGTIDVLGGGIAGVSTVWMALENASKTLCRNIANETVNIVQIKYGDDASTVTHNALFATGHTTLAAFQIWDLGPRSIAGRAARKAGIQFVNDLHKSRSNSKICKIDDTKKVV